MKGHPAAASTAAPLPSDSPSPGRPRDAQPSISASLARKCGALKLWGSPSRLRLGGVGVGVGVYARQEARRAEALGQPRRLRLGRGMEDLQFQGRAAPLQRERVWTRGRALAAPRRTCTTRRAPRRARPRVPTPRAPRTRPPPGPRGAAPQGPPRVKPAGAPSGRARPRAGLAGLRAAAAVAFCWLCRFAIPPPPPQHPTRVAVKNLKDLGANSSNRHPHVRVPAPVAAASVASALPSSRRSASASRTLRWKSAFSEATWRGAKQDAEEVRG